MVWDTTSGLPDDSREADERASERRLRDLRGRVNAARAALSVAPGAADSMSADWRKEAGFLARFGITQVQFRAGVPHSDSACRARIDIWAAAVPNKTGDGAAGENPALPTSQTE
jgi:hypothetical protein